MCVGVLPNQHRARGGGVTVSLNPPPPRGGDKSQSTGPTIHWRNTPQSTGPTLLNPLAQHFSIRRADIASIHPAELSIHRQYNPPTYNPPTVRFGRIHQPYVLNPPTYNPPDEQISIHPADIASIHPAELSIHRQYNPPTYNPPTVRFGRVHQPYVLNPLNQNFGGRGPGEPGKSVH